VSEEIIITDDQLMRAVIREVHFLSAGFSFFDIESSVEEHLSTFGIEESQLIVLRQSLNSTLADMGVKDGVDIELSVNLCILDIYCSIEEALKSKGINVVDVRTGII
jgi:hypothetical protein